MHACIWVSFVSYRALYIAVECFLLSVVVCSTIVSAFYVCGLGYPVSSLLDQDFKPAVI